jgi:hypothetical protein
MGGVDHKRTLMVSLIQDKFAGSLRHWSKPPFGGSVQALEYLGRYTHRVALSNNRILDVKDGQVTFQWKDYRSQDRQKSRTMTLAADEFIRRFLIHTQPPGFQRIRHFGFLSNRYRKEKLALCRKLLKHPVTELLPDVPAALTSPPPAHCPRCETGTMIRLGMVPAYRWPERPPDTS